MAVSSETSLHSVFVVCFQRMGWADHVESTGEMRNAQKFWAEKLKGRNQSEDEGVEG